MVDALEIGQAVLYIEGKQAAIPKFGQRARIDLFFINHITYRQIAAAAIIVFIIIALIIT